MLQSLAIPELIECLLAMTVCNINNESCMTGKCNSCPRGAALKSSITSSLVLTQIWRQLFWSVNRQVECAIAYKQCFSPLTTSWTWFLR
uniref:Putative secreted protein n=1 Tax=Rhipicephalus microplus TaxID=6941 RepID=A0A6G5A308_RHIMP